MTSITPEQRQALEQAGDQPVPVADPQTETTYVLVRADVFQRMQALIDEQRERREEDVLLERSRRARLDWLRENPY
jgi:hypothetical protein